MANDIAQRLKICAVGYDWFLNLGILRTGFYTAEYYVQGEPPAPAQKEAIIDDIVGHGRVKFVSLQFRDKKWKYETGFKRWLANHTGIRVL